MSDAFRLMMIRIAKDKGLPFEPLEPTKAARRGDLTKVGAPDALLTSLNAGESPSLLDTASLER